MTLLVLGLSQQYMTATSALGILYWLCFGVSVPRAVQNSNLALLRQMQGLVQLSDLLRPNAPAADAELKSMGVLLWLHA